MMVGWGAGGGKNNKLDAGTGWVGTPAVRRREQSANENWLLMIGWVHEFFTGDPSSAGCVRLVVSRFVLSEYSAAPVYVRYFPSWMFFKRRSGGFVATRECENTS